MKTEQQVERRIKLVEAATESQFKHLGVVNTADGERGYQIGALYGALYALGWALGGGRWPAWITKPAIKREAKER